MEDRDRAFLHCILYFTMTLLMGTIAIGTGIFMIGKRTPLTVWDWIIVSVCTVGALLAGYFMVKNADKSFPSRQQ